MLALGSRVTPMVHGVGYPDCGKRRFSWGCRIDELPSPEDFLDLWADETGEEVRLREFGRSRLSRIMEAHGREWLRNLYVPDGTAGDHANDECCADCDDEDNCEERCDNWNDSYDAYRRENTNYAIGTLARYYDEFASPPANAGADALRAIGPTGNRSGGKRLPATTTAVHRMLPYCSTRNCLQCAHSFGPTLSKLLYGHWPYLLGLGITDKDLMQWHAKATEWAAINNGGADFPNFDLAYILGDYLALNGIVTRRASNA